jgi:hypothetical protein
MAKFFCVLRTDYTAACEGLTLGLRHRGRWRGVPEFLQSGFTPVLRIKHRSSTVVHHSSLYVKGSGAAAVQQLAARKNFANY